MTEHTLFYYSYVSFTNAQLSLLKVATPYCDKLLLLDPIGASWATIGADHHAREAVRCLKDAGVLQIVALADVLAKYTTSITDAIRWNVHDWETLSTKKMIAGSIWAVRDTDKQVANIAIMERTAVQKGNGTWLIG